MKWTAAIAVIIFIILVLSATEQLLANPEAQPSVIVHSPVNNQIYPTNEIELNVIPFPYPSNVVNFTLNYYILDDQSPISTNGTGVLNNLSPGSHTLKFYGTFSSQLANSTHEQKDALVRIIYFSVIYSTQWVLFTTALVLFIAIICLVLFTKRRQIKVALKSQKRGVFYVGSALLLLSSVPTIYFIWQIADNYLFPYSPPKHNVLEPTLPFIISMFFLTLGLSLLWLGIRKKTDAQSQLQFNVLIACFRLLRVPFLY